MDIHHSLSQTNTNTKIQVAKNVCDIAKTTLKSQFIAKNAHKKFKKLLKMQVKFTSKASGR